MSMTRTATLLVGCLLASLGATAADSSLPPSQSHAPSETLQPRMQLPLLNVPGKTFTSSIVSFPPGARAAPHRHGEAFVYAYVLSGSVRSQLDDQPAKVYRTGDDWYEAPGTHHKLTENTSKSEPARLLVVFVAPTGASLKTPE
jgi:quercetin dioxygenase-like cupin family protein